MHSMKCAVTLARCGKHFKCAGSCKRILVFKYSIFILPVGQISQWSIDALDEHVVIISSLDHNPARVSTSISASLSNTVSALSSWTSLGDIKHLSQTVWQWLACKFSVICTRTRSSPPDVRSLHGIQGGPRRLHCGEPGQTLASVRSRMVCHIAYPMFPLHMKACPAGYSDGSSIQDVNCDRSEWFPSSVMVGFRP